MNKKILSIGCDHAAYNLKLKLIPYLEEKGYEILDVGTDSPDSCDYPVFAKRVCENIQNGVCELGILICGTGIGMSMAANKHRGIRAAVCSDTFSARATRQHNNANVLCFGERVVGYGMACELVDAFLDTPFEGGKHQRRVDMLTAIEDAEK
ncbi:MAG: ribose 5-phosphate isomerase B [Clostridia bacterium]|nr:ribose 5-phosphate isomerase B [Clostridia bacterium]MBQ5612560.1 ribose 5-phosphate isomerase B [Clostridia bacterium]MBQ5661433.1 ribose 5-phosphate isomerase B [Clostridia bacterium]MBQ5772520.1 ribose 5-phosphate isomerase B [Clostridia bacterium]